jgi:transposase
MKAKCPVAGIDIGKEFCYLAVLSPDGKQYLKPVKVINNRSGWEDMLLKFKKIEEVFNERPKILLESTGHFSENFLSFFTRNDYKVFLINPLQSHSIKNFGIRKAKTDKLDCVEIAKLYSLADLREYVKPNEYTYNLKVLTRAYAKYSEERTVTLNQLESVLDQAMPGYTKIFTHIGAAASIELLCNYSSPKAILNSDKNAVIKLIKTASRRSLKAAENKYELLTACAKDAEVIGVKSEGLYKLIKFYSDEVKHKNEQLRKLEKEIRMLQIDIPAVELLKSIPCIGDNLASTIAAEIGDISRFKNAKQLIAYCGIDPSVRQSGNFIGNKNKLTKRGSPYLRRALYIAAISSIKHKDNKYTNKILYEYYEKKIQSKVKKQAIGAIMNKLVRIIFSVLKNNHKFITITPDEQIEMYKHSLRQIA